jgi:hypothetical protein
MLTLHIHKLDQNIVIPEVEFSKVIEKLKEYELINIEIIGFDDLEDASSTSLKFWDNRIDDELWNHA